jgi:hypothetical protein
VQKSLASLPGQQSLARAGGAGAEEEEGGGAVEEEEEEEEAMAGSGGGWVGWAASCREGEPEGCGGLGR